MFDPTFFPNAVGFLSAPSFAQETFIGQKSKYDGKAILDLPMNENDAEAETVRDYLKALLRALIEEGEGFSGKRPLGNSGWEDDLYLPLVTANIIKGTFDLDDPDDPDSAYLDTCDTVAGNKAIQAAIDAL